MHNTPAQDSNRRAASMASTSGVTPAAARQGNAPCIVVVTDSTRPTLPLMEYVVRVAGRLHAKILLVSINPRSSLLATSPLSVAASTPAGSEADPFRALAGTRGLAYERIAESGNPGKVVSRLCHIVKRVEFVVVDQGVKMEEVAAGSSVPVFSVVQKRPAPSRSLVGRQTRTFSFGERGMKTASRRTYVAKTVIFGAMTAALYAAVFSYSEVIMHYWTKGGFYALLPVATVFVFSYAHGSFTGNFWSALGIEGSKASAAKQKETEVSTSKTANKRPDTRPRVQANV